MTANEYVFVKMRKLADADHPLAAELNRLADILEEAFVDVASLPQTAPDETYDYLSNIFWDAMQEASLCYSKALKLNG